VGSAVLSNAVATTVSQTAPTLNQNASLKLGIRNFTARDANAYLWWSQPFPLGVTILNAEIIFYTTAIPESGSHTLMLTRLGVGFSASKVSYSTRPLTFIAGDKTLAKTGPNPDKTEWRFNVTDWMQTIANGGKWYGVRLVPQTVENIARWIYSELWTDASLRPRLEVSWSDAPSIPTGLSPGGGRAVSVQKPVVRGTFRDFSGSTTLAFIQVQINATDVWTAPSYDTGAVPASVPELDLARTDMPGGTWAGLADGASTFWRMRFQDAGGVWSAWSAATSFTRDIKGTLTVNNPPVGTPKVEDATPPIAWAFTLETQSAYQVQIKHKINGVEFVDWDTGKITGTLTSITVPAGKINQPTNTTYTVTVRIWDTKQRETTPNDPAYVEVVRDFTFIPGATTGSTGLTAVADAIRPKVVLTWQAATFPDRFNVLRNGKVIAAALDPTFTFVSGTTHTWTDDSPSPTRALVYEIQRVVGDIASSSNATATVTVPAKRAIWLREPVTGLEVPIFTSDSPDFDLGETTAALKAIAPDAPTILINQNLSGLEGPIAGSLIDAYSQTAQYWRDQFLKMRDLRVKQFWLTVGDITIRAVAQGFKYKQRADTEDIVFDVSCQIYQQDRISNIYIGS
jgi:hypothetical protein